MKRLSEVELQYLQKDAEAEIVDRNKVPYNQFAEYCLDLIDEIKVLRSPLIVSSVIRRLNENNQQCENDKQLYLARLEYYESEAEHYKEALEKIYKFCNGFESHIYNLAKEGLRGGKE